MPAPRRHPQQSPGKAKKLPRYTYLVEVRAPGHQELHYRTDDTEADAEKFAANLVDIVEKVFPGQASVFIHRFERNPVPICIKWASDKKLQKAKK